MRIIRLRVADFRGTVAREVHFDSGVTVVEGPNEVGKSTLAEALGLLLDPGLKSDSRKQGIERVRPIGRDAVPEVEAEIEAGPFRFIYRKRFSHKKRQGGGTELEVLTPRSEQLAGDDAVRRVEEILRETLDVDLFRALQVEQGRAIDQVQLGGKGWLGDALDRASGGEGVDGDSHESLFTRAAERSREYYSEKNATESRLLTGARAEASLAEERIGELADRLRRIEVAVAEHARLTQALHSADQDLPTLEAEASAHRADVDRLTQLEHRGKETADRAATQAARVDKLEVQHVARTKATAKIDQLTAKLDAAQARLLTSDEHVAALRTAQDNASNALRAARQHLSKAEDGRAEARRDVDWLERNSEVESLQRRRTDAAACRAQLDGLQQRLRDDVDETSLQELEQLERKLDAVRTALRTETSQLSVDALRDVELKIDEEPRCLRKGERFAPAAGESVELTLPDVLRIHLRAGTGAEPLRAEAEKTERTLRDRLRELGAADFEQAQQRAREARDARIEQDAVQVRLADLTEGIDVAEGLSIVELLDTAIADGEREIEHLRAARADGRPEPYDVVHTREQAAAAEVAESRARDDERRAQEASEAATAALATAVAEHAALDAGARALAEQLADAQAQLEADRRTIGDVELEAELGSARTQHDSLRAEADTLRARLEDEDLDARRHLAENAVSALADAHTRRQKDENELHAQLAVLRHEEGEGLGERLQEAEADRAERQRELELVERRAAAAKLLFDTLRRRRDEARAAYVRPLAHRIERLGRIVFGDTFGIEMDDDLTIASRTVRNLPVPFDDLSVGTREQLDLLLRLAAAMAVEERGGVPLILDDTLGNADPERLARMNALLGLAGRNVQVIILTCHPERFARIGGAHFVRLSDDGQPGSTRDG